MSNIWAVDCDNRKRHCWDYQPDRRIREGTLDKVCKLDHSDDPKVVGKVEWLRFIHEWNHVPNIFTGDGDLHLNHLGTETSDGRHAYAEEYHDKKGKLIFRVFLASDEGWARIECYEPDLFEECDKTWALVQASYLMDSAITTVDDGSTMEQFAKALNEIAKWT